MNQKNELFEMAARCLQGIVETGVTIGTVSTLNVLEKVRTILDFL